ncbi:MAG: SDR family NAD(P)-dependent oxidoreductase [Balneola sp.]|jgi:3-hydroxy acid dehydrogenase/malonic semialdehyde reductase
MNRLSGKNIIITGATSGIGRAAAYQFGELGANLFLTGRRDDRLKEIKNDLLKAYPDSEINTYTFDLADRNACNHFVESIDCDIDVLINNAGLALGKDAVYELDRSDIDQVFAVNVQSLLELTRLISPQMKARNAGHIINVGSAAGHEAYAGGVVYCATKHAVKAITESTKKDLHGTEVRVSMVSPGMVETEFSNVRFKGDNEKAESVYKGFKPLTADDIAEIIVFIANRPEHVNIMDTIIYPVSQSSPIMVHRNE